MSFERNEERATSNEEGRDADRIAVAILTVTTNGAGHLPAYLDALGAITWPGRDLWVVDNGSTDRSAELVEARFPAARVLRNGRNLGFTGACNRALRLMLEQEGGGRRGEPRPTRPDYVLFLNDDTEVTPGFLEPLLTVADERTLVAPRTYLAGRPGVLDDAAGDFDWWRGAWKRRVPGTRERREDRAVREVETANLSCLLVPTGAFREVGLLDDAFFVYYDDTDFCRRARLAGYRIVVQPGSVVYHRKGATLGGQASAFGCYYLARNRPYLIRKHRGQAAFAVFFAYFLATRAARMTLWAASGRFDLCGATLRGIRDFLRGRMGGQGPGIGGRGPGGRGSGVRGQGSGVRDS